MNAKLELKFETKNQDGNQQWCFFKCRVYKETKIIPNVVDEVGEPILDLRVVYRYHIEVSSGVAMRVQQTHQKPRVEMRGSPFGTAEDLYTILMVDPDAPTPKDPAFRCYLHWLVVNIPGETPPTTGMM